MVVRLSDLERKLLTLAFDPSASVGESMNALRVIFRNWVEKYPDGHALVKDLESREVREKIIYRSAESPYGNLILNFGKYRGKAIGDVPVEYLIWVRDNFEDLWPQTRKAIERYLGED
jgi:hypothetical protein